jgi:(E)-4-hydroxy-3-methylbut-2-enyl-diphosphate synthase
LPPSPNVYPFFRELADWEPARLSGYIHPETNFVGVRLSDGGAMLKALNQPQTVGVVLGTPYEARAVVQFLRSGGCQAPLVRLTTTDVPEALPVPLETGLQVESVFQCGQGLVDGLWDGLWLQPAQFLLARLGQTASARLLNRMSFGILQAARLRMTKTEYISCPSCGRTLFDLMETTARIRSRTEHLKGVKIGIMGCIVNGPGEMADADYGYVGAGPGVISLYKGQEMKVKAVPTAEAVDRLIELIAEDGRWVPPPNESMQS